VKAISERKRAKQTGKGRAPDYLGIPKWILRSPEFAAIKGGPLKLLIDIAMLYNGFNNGNLSIAEIRHRWPSRSMTTRAEKWLISNGWIVKTRLGGLGMGPDLFAITWWPVQDCKGKHAYTVENVASHLWMKTRTPDPNQVRAVPESGTGMAPKSSQTCPAVPEMGTKEAIFPSRPVPETGNPYRLPSGARS